MAIINEIPSAVQGVTTANTMISGDVFVGEINPVNDADWVAINLIAGESYTFAVSGITLSDPTVALYNSYGTQIGYDDDGGPGLNAMLTVVATYSGLHYVAASAFSSAMGMYELNVTGLAGAPVSYVATSGDDILTGTNTDDTIDLLAGNDSYVALDGNDNVLGGQGWDTIDGGAGNDTIDGGSGRDSIIGGEGDDRLMGGNNNDRLFGGDGDDFVDGGRNADTIDGGTGDDVMRGGAQDDRVYAGQGLDTVYGGGGDDVISGEGGADELHGGKGNDWINGNGGTDIVDGGSGDDTVYGGGSNDILTGGDGADIINGGRGHDTMNGGTGDDALIGGDGNDVFIFNVGDGSDTISDFEDGVDLFDMSDFSGDAIHTLLSDPGFSATGSAVIFFFSTGDELRIEADGGTPFTLTSDDFIL